MAAGNKTMTQQLYLLRHAQAESWNPLGNDFSRPLSSEGAHHAELLSGWAFESLSAPDTILCSPAKRTRETLAPLLGRWPQLLSTTDYVDSIYGASLNVLLTIAEDAFSFSQRLMIVGHYPGIRDVLVDVLQPGQASAIKSMDTGTMAVIEFSSNFKRHASSGNLIHLVKRSDFSVN